MRKRTTPLSRRGSMWMSDGALLERVLPQPVDDVDDVLIVGVELSVLPSSTSCSKLRASEMSPFEVSCAFFIDRAGFEELAQEAPDILRVGEDQLDS